jgi:hypothetical protein
MCILEHAHIIPLIEAKTYATSCKYAAAVPTVLLQPRLDIHTQKKLLSRDIADHEGVILCTAEVLPHIIPLGWRQIADSVIPKWMLQFSPRMCECEWMPQPGHLYCPIGEALEKITRLKWRDRIFFAHTLNSDNVINFDPLKGPIVFPPITL